LRPPTLAPNQTIVGAMHTHPYPGLSDPNISFSGDDLSKFALRDYERFTVVRTEGMVFLVSKTAQFDAILAQAKAQSKQYVLLSEINKTATAAYEDATSKGSTMAAAIDASVKAVCAKYHLVFYKGNNGRVSKQ
jgi:hypothetical protein